MPANGFFPPAVERLYARYLDAPMLACVRAVCADHARQYAAQADPVSHGYLAFHLAVGLGVARPDASRAGTLLDAIQPMIDLADNLADEELDRARGLTLAARYPGVAREVLHCLPSLMTGCVVAALHEGFPAPGFDPHGATARVIRALARMSAGQGMAPDDPGRMDGIAGHQALLLCLPLWLSPAAPERDARLAAIEPWALRYGRLWHLRQEVIEAPGDDAVGARFADARRDALAAWPDFAPFAAGDALAPEALLAGGAP